MAFGQQISSSSFKEQLELEIHILLPIQPYGHLLSLQHGDCVLFELVHQVINICL